MLKLLRINNIALIASLELELGEGLTLLTGETGAGKSILIDALGLLLGARASTDLIRTGQEQALVEAVAEAPGLGGVLESRGLPAEGDEVILRRDLHVSGRGKATLNGALVPLSLLRELAPLLVAIHGQHEPQGLLLPDTHLDLLDRHAGLEAAAAALAEEFRGWRELESALAALRQGRREAARNREMLEFQATEIEQARLSPAEEEELRREKVLQANAGRLASLSEEAYASLFEDEGAVLTRLGQVFRRVEELAGIDPRFPGLKDERAAVKAQLEELALSLRDYRERIHASPQRLDEIESRLALIERLKRKYGASLEEVLAFARRCRQQLLELGDPQEREQALEAEQAKKAARYREGARLLSRARRASARDLEKKVQAELAQLAMEKTRFQVRFEPEEQDEPPAETWSERGLEQAEFVLSPNPGEELRSLARIASGGELSRIMLALKSVAHLDEHGKTLVFDEVDAGIGGRVAEVVGRKLRAMAATHQVLCVTHLPQIASLADRHLVVRKRVERGRTLTTVQEVTGPERIDEIARMLGGELVTDSARRHAQEMVKQSLRS